MRFSSDSSMRIHTARSGMSSSMPSSFSTAIENDELVVQRAEVVHARDVRAALHVGQLLAGLLHAGVEVADDGLAAQDGLALELEHEAQHTMGARVLRTHVDDHRLVVGGLCLDGGERCGLGLAHPQDGRRPRGAAPWRPISLRGRSS